MFEFVTVADDQEFKKRRDSFYFNIEYIKIDDKICKPLSYVLIHNVCNELSKTTKTYFKE